MKKSHFFRNTIWILKINWKYARLISFTRFIGYINDYAGNLLRAFITGLIIDWIIIFISNPSDQTLLLYILLIFGVYYLINGFANALRNYGSNLIYFKIGNEVPRVLLYEKLNSLGTAELEKPEVQNKIQRYQENQYIFHEITRIFLIIIGIVLSLIIAAIPLFALLPGITILLIVASIPAFIINKIMINKLWDLDKEVTVLSRRAYSIVYSLSNPATLKEIRLLNSFEYLKNYFTEYISKYFGEKVRIYNKWTLSDIFNSILIGTVILFGIYQLILLATSGVISVGQIAFYLSALTSVSGLIDSLSANVASYMGSSSRLSEMMELLNYEAKVSNNKEKLELLKNPPLIKLENVNFKYPGSEKFVIKNLNLEIKPGEKIAIVGENGAGKTTLVKLISNIYPVSEGKILINDKNLNDFEEDSWFKNIGVLYQDYNTYEDLSVFENIALGKINEEISYQKIKEAAKKADASGFIEEYKNKYSQVLSERYEDGIRPSTGQWQKIAIARFFYRNSPILILDEPTASIDAVAEANIFDRIYQFIENKTVIIISHRFATVRKANRIIVFDHGKIVEEGTHDELLAMDGKYAHAFKLQAQGYS